MEPATPVGEDVAAMRSDFYLKVAIASLCLLGINLATAWILQYYFHQSVNGNISFVGTDPSWIPKGTHFGPALGTHYFGDFEQYLGYATSSIPPYSSAIGFPAAYGPVSIVLVRMLNDIFGWPGAVLVFLPATLLLFLWGIFRLLGSFLSARLLAILLLFSAGILVSLDRGNLQILVAGLCVWFCIGLLEDRPRISIASLALAIAIKPYLAMLIIVLIKARRWRDTGLVVGGTAVLYAAGFALLGGDYLRSVRNFMHTNLLFASSPSKGFVLGCVSAASAVYKVLYLSWGPQHFNHFLNHSPTWYIQVPGIVAGIACLLIIWLSNRPLEFALIAALAMMQLAPASTYPYVSLNIVIELCLFVRVAAPLQRRGSGAATASADFDPPVPRSVLLVCVALLVIGATPWFGMLYGRSGTSTPISELMSAVTNFGVVLALLTGLLMGNFRTRRHRHSARHRLAKAARKTQLPVPDAPIPVDR